MDPRLADAMLRAGIIDLEQADRLRGELRAIGIAELFGTDYPPGEGEVEGTNDQAAEAGR